MISVVVATWNTRELVRRCLASVERQRAGVDLELIVVDNASTDGTAAMVRAEFPAATLLVMPDNLGYSGGMNAGLRRAKGDLVILLNSDTVVHDGAFARFHQALAPLADVGAACPRCIGEDGLLQSHGFKFLTARDYLRRIGGWPVHDDPRDPERSGYVDTPSGACLGLTRRGIAALGQLDERLPMFLEEQDIARRLAAAGLRSYYVADAVVTHLRGRTVALLDADAVWLADQRSHAYVYRRHFRGLVSLGLRLAAIAVLAASLLRPRRWARKLAALRAHLA